MAEDDRRIPAGTGVVVLLIVIVLIAAVLISQRIPHALRPTMRQPPVTTVVTVTSSPTPAATASR